MRTYAQFRPTFWTRGSGKKLRGKRDAQVLAVYLMSAPPSSMTGLYYQPMVAILHDLGMSEEAFRKALEEVAEIAQYDDEEELVWLPNGCREQMGLKDGTKIKTGDKRLPGVRSEVEAFGNHPFAVEFRQRYLPGTNDNIEPHAEGHHKGHADKGDSKGHARRKHGACSVPVPDPVPVPDLMKQDPPDRSPPRAPEQAPGPILCPADLRLTDDQRASLKTMPEVPDWAIDQLTREFITNAQADPDDRRPVVAWRKCLAKMVSARWLDPNKRPKEPPPSEAKKREANRRKREWEQREAEAAQARLAAQATPEDVERFKSEIGDAWK